MTEKIEVAEINVIDACAMQVKVHVSGESENPAKMNLRAGKFRMVIDEPEKMGGTNDGEMNPCNFMGCSYDERAGFQTINVNVKPDFELASKEEIRDWLEEPNHVALLPIISRQGQS